MPRIRTFRIRQAVSFRAPDLRNSSADAKTSARSPTDLSRLLMASRTDSSSSTIETRGVSDALDFSCTPLLSVGAFIPLRKLTGPVVRKPLYGGRAQLYSGIGCT